jgi:hypothetical protein
MSSSNRFWNNRAKGQHSLADYWLLLMWLVIIIVTASEPSRQLRERLWPSPAPMIVAQAREPLTRVAQRRKSGRARIALHSKAGTLELAVPVNRPQVPVPSEQ